MDGENNGNEDDYQSLHFHKRGEIHNELFILGKFRLSTLANVENEVGQTKIVSETENTRQREIAEHSANAFRLFEEAKRIQQRLRTLPFIERGAAMNRVNALEQAAVEEARKSIALEKRLL